ncbi:MAG: hypothetical protein M1818_001674 [Claussenomyces sp. TS43310]|nr:MAG: hypothetical protein M1818_001674 [Claussenomyces sp. TS43310]
MAGKKYKEKLTQRLNLQPRTRPDTETNSEDSSSSRITLPLLDLRGQFFSQDDGSQRSPSVQTLETQGSEEKGAFFKLRSKGYEVPAEQSQGAESAFPSSAIPQITSAETTHGAVCSPLPQKPAFTRIQSYHHGYDVSEASRTDPFPGLTPLASPLPTGDPYVKGFPFDLSTMRKQSPLVVAEAPNQMTAQREMYTGTSHADGMSPMTRTSSSSHSKTSRSLGSSYQPSLLKEELAGLTFVDEDPSKSQGSFGSYGKLKTPQYDEEPFYEPKYQKGRRAPKKWYGIWSTRKIILAVTALVLLVGLIVGLSVGLWRAKVANKGMGLSPSWRPAIGTSWQIQLETPVTTITKGAYIYDIDLFDNSADTIKMLHASGKRVICYFSAGTYESWRPDADQFPKSTIGKALPGWTNENYIDIRSKDVVNIMNARIKLALQKGCDGVDPDNVDSYEADTGFPLAVTDSVKYVNSLGQQTHMVSMAMGLKNAPGLVNGTFSSVDWQINESCATDNSCALSHPFIQAGKPVFHIEYAANATLPVLKNACNANGSHLFSTLIKKTELDMWSASCPYGDPVFVAW